MFFPKDIWMILLHLKQKTQKRKTSFNPCFQLLPHFSCYKPSSWKSFLYFLSPYRHVASIPEVNTMWVSYPSLPHCTMAWFSFIESHGHLFEPSSFALQHYPAPCTTHSWRFSFCGSLPCLKHFCFFLSFFSCSLDAFFPLSRLPARTFNLVSLLLVLCFGHSKMWI